MKKNIHKLKKTKLLIALCLSGSMGFAQLETNGGFESYNTLPACPASGTSLSDVNSWYEVHKGYNLSQTPPHLCSPVSSSEAVYYYNNSTGGNGSCEPIAAHSGNGFITTTQSHVNPPMNGYSETVYEPISSTLYASKKYLFTAYAYNGSSFTTVNIAAGLSNFAGLDATAPTPTVTGTTGWCLVQSILTVPSDGSYTLAIGSNSNVCFVGGSYSFAIDDISLQVLPCVANAGPNVIDHEGCIGWGTSGVTIGTASVTGLSYSWAPGTNLSSTTVAQPVSSWSNTSTPVIYTVTVSGSTCATATSTVQVTASSLCYANAGPNVIDQQACCGSGWPGVQIGTASLSGCNYSWLPTTKLNNASIAQPTSTWSNTTTPEIYTVTVTGSVGGCTANTSTVQVSAQAYTGSSCCRLAAGISNENQTSAVFAVYPNPAKEQVIISLSAKAEYIRIMDMQGRLVYETKNADAGELKIDLARFVKGMYFVSAKMGDNVEKQKLIVE